MSVSAPPVIASRPWVKTSSAASRVLLRIAHREALLSDQSCWSIGRPSGDINSTHRASVRTVFPPCEVLRRPRAKGETNPQVLRLDGELSASIQQPHDEAVGACGTTAKYVKLVSAVTPLRAPKKNYCSTLGHYNVPVVASNVWQHSHYGLPASSAPRAWGAPPSPSATAAPPPLPRQLGVGGGG